MVTWYIYGLAAFLCYGLQSFFYKVAAKRNCNSTHILFSFMTTVAVLGTILLLLTGKLPENYSYLILLSFLNAFSFLVVTFSTIEALKYFPTNTFFPAIRTNVVLVVLFSLVYFNDSLTPTQIAALLLSIPVIFLLLTKSERDLLSGRGLKKGAPFVITALVGSAFVTIVVKLGADLNTPFWFITLSYGMNVFFSLGLVKTPLFQKNRSGSPKRCSWASREGKGGRALMGIFDRGSVIMGIEIGLVNFLGFVALLNALARGPLSLIAALVSLSFVVAIVLSWIFYKEQMTRIRAVVVALAVAACILLGI